MQWKNLNAGKIQVKRFNDAFRKLNSEHNTRVELYGITGVDEHSSCMIEICGRNVRPEVAAAQDRIGQLFNFTLTSKNAADVVTEIEAAIPALVASRPVDDNRRTPDQDAAQKAEFAENQRKQADDEKQKRQVFDSLYGSGQALTIPAGSVVVTASLKYDNSDLMSDYFDTHATLSPDYVLLIARKQAETESLARQAVSLFEILRGHEFSWHTEKYSLGHGNYLQSKAFELPAELHGCRQRYGAGDVTHGHWEIEFSHASCSTMMALKGYGEAPVPIEPTASAEGITVSENTEKAGIEIRFPNKPSDDVLSSLHANGWRWARGSRCWYKRASDDARRFAGSFAVLHDAQRRARNRRPPDGD